MSIKAVLFDLDGTLLPMNQDDFVKRYFSLLAKKLAQHGYEPGQLIDAIWKGTGAMVKNNGSRTNEEAFWDCFAAIMGEQVRGDIPIFDAYYRKEFEGARDACGFNPKAAEAVAAVRRAGLRAILATNPLFPAVATQKRIGWAGFSPDDFEFYTTYENARYCKPNPDYYREILDRIHLQPEECLMVGNDVEEDMISQSLGMRVFLLTDCLINKRDADISAYPHGGFDELIRFIEDI